MGKAALAADRVVAVSQLVAAVRVAAVRVVAASPAVVVDRAVVDKAVVDKAVADKAVADKAVVVRVAASHPAAAAAANTNVGARVGSPRARVALRPWTIHRVERRQPLHLRSCRSAGRRTECVRYIP